MSREAREHLSSIFAAALAAVDPVPLVERVLRRTSVGLEIHWPEETVTIDRSVMLVGAGKAAVRMAAAFESCAEGVVAVQGAVVAPIAAGSATCRRVRVLHGEHPIPGVRGLEATRRMVGLLRATSAEHVVCVISGGASSLLVWPLEPITLEEKQEVTELLLCSGAEIGEINTVRKHLSAVKGGRLLKLVAPRPMTTLLLSDVIGNDPATIGSGPSVPDETTFAEAIEVLQRHQVWRRCAAAVREVLESGRHGGHAETVRRSSEVGRAARAVVLGSNETALCGARRRAQELGYDVEVGDRPLSGDTTRAARQWLGGLGASNSRVGPRCWLAGGETTVEVRGTGVGGRNQEFALALVDEIAASGMAILSAGTDGVDGPTSAAGAFVDGSSARRARRAGLDPAAYLANNDSYRFFEKLDDLLVCGPTGTNVMDLKIAVHR